MSGRVNWYFKQPVQEDELDLAFTELEQADRYLIEDQGLYGIFTGGLVAQHSPVADLTVDVSGPMIGYDPNGQRILIPGPKIVVDVSADSQSVSTAVAGAGNEKWVSITAKFTRVLSDPRIDGNSNTVYFREDESYEVVVVQGAEALIGTATRPSLDPDGLLLADVNRTNGQTQVFNADISATDTDGRRQDTFVFSQTPLSIRAGMPKDAVEAMLTKLNQHINTVGVAHPLDAISATASPNWKDASNITPTDAQDYVDTIVSTLGASTGAVKIGTAAHGALSAGSIQSQLNELEDEKAALAGATFTGAVVHASTVKVNTPNFLDYGTRTIDRALLPILCGLKTSSSAQYLHDGGASPFLPAVTTEINAVAGNYCLLALDLPDGSKLLSVDVNYHGHNTGGVGTVAPAFHIVRAPVDGGVPTDLGGPTSGPAPGAGWLSDQESVNVAPSGAEIIAGHDIIDRTTYVYYIQVDEAYDAGIGAAMLITGLVAHYSITDSRPA